MGTMSVQKTFLKSLLGTKRQFLGLEEEHGKACSAVLPVCMAWDGGTLGHDGFESMRLKAG